MNKGKVKFFNGDKGFGFITDSESKQEYFVHKTGLKQGFKPNKDDNVLFDVEQGKKGEIAVNVCLNPK